MADLAVRVDAGDLRKLYGDLKASGSDLTVALRRGVKKAAEPMRTAVAAEASFSTRIPSAVKTKASFAGRRSRVEIIVDSGAAPHAAAINHGGRSGTFRHPVYADQTKTRNEWTWVAQAANPFFDAPIRAHYAAAEAAMLAVMDDVARKAGFR